MGLKNFTYYVFCHTKIFKESTLEWNIHTSCILGCYSLLVMFVCRGNSSQNYAHDNLRMTLIFIPFISLTCLCETIFFRNEHRDTMWKLMLEESWLLSVNNGIISSVYVNILGKCGSIKHMERERNMEDTLLKSFSANKQVKFRALFLQAW